jgi:hypothetical protein
VPSVSATGVSTSTMFAPGAMACDHSTSSVVSPAQLWSVPLVGSKFTGPSGWMTLMEGGSGIPNCASNVDRSDTIDGEPNASTSTMVWPLPVMPRWNKGCSL